MDGLLSRLLNASLQGVIAFVAVLLLVNLFRGLSPTAKGWLWRLCGLKFLVAFAFIVGIPLLPNGNELVNPSPIPSFPTEQFVAQTTKATTVSQPLSTTTPDWTYLFILLWGTGATVLLAGRVVKELRARSQIFSQATLVSLDTPGRFFVSPNVHSPLVVGLIRPSIVLPAGIIDHSDELAMAVAHEQAHIQRHDVAWQAILNLAACLFWFLPPIHWISTFAKGEAESACDRAVLNSTGKTPGQYARFLVRLAKRPPTITTLGMAAQTRHQLTRRIQSMNNRPRPRRAVLAAIAILSLPALIPWQAVAQERTITSEPVERLESLAMFYLFLPGSESAIVLTAEQQAKLKEQAVKSNKEVRDFGQALEDMKLAGVSDKERIEYDIKRRMPMFRRHMRERWEILSLEQKSRQKQIVLQYLGPLVLGNESIAKLVGASASQAKAIAKIDEEYKSFMEKQNEFDWMDMRKMLGGNEIRLRDFTKSEKSRLAEIEKQVYTASGKKRSDLKNEYYKIRSRAIRYEGGQMDNLKSEEFQRRRSEMAKALMTARRKEFARLSDKALNVLTPNQRKRWVQVQGDSITFKKLESNSQIIFSYR